MLNTFKHPSVIINLSSGSTTDVSEDMSGIFASHGYTPPQIHAVDAAGLKAAFQTVREDGTDLLVIYGGDGTCKSGAVVAIELSIPIIALPGGTMNMLPKALYGTDDWAQALEKALSNPKPRSFPAGKINDELFFCGAIIGDPTNMAEARESIRDGDILDAIKKVPDVVSAITEGNPISYTVDGKPYARSTNLLHLFCPVMVGDPETETKLELTSVPTFTVPDLFAAGVRSLISGWRDTEQIDVRRVKIIEIKGQGAFDILLDGEAAQVECPIKISLQQDAVKVLAPTINAEMP